MDEMKQMLRDCNVGAYCEVASSTNMVLYRLTDIYKVDANDAHVRGPILAVIVVTHGPAKVETEREGSPVA